MFRYLREDGRIFRRPLGLLLAGVAGVVLVMSSGGLVSGGTSQAWAADAKPDSATTKRIIKSEASGSGASVNAGAFEDWVLEIRDTSGIWVQFTRGAAGDVIHRWQVCVNCGWSGWASLGGRIVGSPDAEVFPDGRLVVFAIDSATKQLIHKWQVCDGCNWSGWVSLGGGLSSNPSVVRKATNVLVAFAVAFDGDLWHTWQVCAGCTWSVWTSLSGGPFISSPTAGRLSDDRLDVVVRRGDGWRYRAQLCNGCAWGAWRFA